jgi:hypothetical protein
MVITGIAITGNYAVLRRVPRLVGWAPWPVRHSSCC